MSCDRKRKIISLLLIPALFLTLFPSSALGEETAAEISTLAELEFFRDSVNGGDTYEGKIVRLMADIDLSETCGPDKGSWEPIGSREKAFRGTFDGNGREIKNLYIRNASRDPVNDSAYHYRGLFGYLGGGVIRDLTVSGEVYATRWSGGICGESVENTRIENCCSAVNVAVPDNAGHGESMGGICGSNKGTIVNCYNTGGVSGVNNVGGICGFNNSSGVVENCYNIGNVSNRGGSSIGGICGVQGGTVENCFYLETCGAEGAGESVTAEAFGSGRVAHLLQSGQTAPAEGEQIPQVWGQTLSGGGADAFPVLSGDAAKRVCKVTFLIKDDAGGGQAAEHAAAYANPGGTVTLPSNPVKSGCTFVKWAVSQVGEAFTAETVVNNDLTLTAFFRENAPAPVPPPTPETDAPCPRDETCPLRSFTDADPTAWYHDGVHYCLKEGLIRGFGNGKLGPNEDLTRAELAQILYNRAGCPSVAWESPFEDVGSGAWYAPAVTWAASQNMVFGYGSGLFGPGDRITREQLVTVLWRYAGEPASNGSLSGFLDGGQVSGYAETALRWAVENGVVQGRGGGVLDPAGPASRAEAAAMLMNLFGA